MSYSFANNLAAPSSSEQNQHNLLIFFWVVFKPSSYTFMVTNLPKIIKTIGVKILQNGIKCAKNSVRDTTKKMD